MANQAAIPAVGEAIPDDLLPDELKAKPAKIQASAPGVGEAIPEDLLPDELKVAAPPVAKEGPSFIKRLAQAAEGITLPKPAPVAELPKPTPVAEKPKVEPFDAEKMASEVLSFGRLEPMTPQKYLEERAIEARVPGDIIRHRPEVMGAPAQRPFRKIVDEKPVGLMWQEPKPSVLAEEEPMHRPMPKVGPTGPTLTQYRGGEEPIPSEEGITSKAARYVLRHMGVGEELEEKLLGPKPDYSKEEIEREIEAQKTIDPTQSIFPSPTEFYQRERGAEKVLARKLFGKSRLSQAIEELGAILPTPLDIPGSADLYPDPDSKLTPKLADWYKKNPEAEKKAREIWAPIRARRKAAGEPLHGEGLPFIEWSTERFKPEMEQVEKEQKERQLTGPVDWAYDVGVDVATVLGGLINFVPHLIDQTVFPHNIPETPQIEAAKERINKAAQGGAASKDMEAARKALHDAQQEAIGGVVGEELGGMVGQAGGLLKGLTNPLETNTALTHTLSLWVTFVEPLRAAYKYSSAAKSAILDSAIKKAEAGVKETAKAAATQAVDQAIDPLPQGTKSKLGQFVDWFTQYAADSVYLGNKDLAAALDDVIHNRGEGLDSIREKMLRFLRAGKVKLSEPELQEVELAFKPKKNVRAEEVATRKAEKATAEAEQAYAQQEFSRETAQKVRELDDLIDSIKNRADQLQKTIDRASKKESVLKERQELADLTNQINYLDKKKAEFVRESEIRQKAEAKTEEAGLAGAGFAERAEAAIPAFVTSKMKKRLRDAGFTPEAVAEMDALHATQIIRKLDENALAEEKRKAKATETEIKKSMVAAEKAKPAAEEAAERGIKPSQVLFERFNAARDQAEASRRAEAGKPIEIPSAPEAPLPSAKEAKATKEEILRAMLKAEGLRKKAEAARERGDKNLQKFLDRYAEARDKYEDMRRGQAAEAATAGVKFAAGVKEMPGAEEAVAAAKRAAAGPAAEAARTRRAAERLTEESEAAGARPEVNLGRIYVPKDFLEQPTLTVEEIRKRAEHSAQSAKKGKGAFYDTPEMAKEKAEDLRVVQEAAQKDNVRVSAYRAEMDAAQRRAIEAQVKAQEATAAREKIQPTSKNQEAVRQAQLNEMTAVSAAEAAAKAAERAERNYRLIRDVDLPNKTPEFVAGEGAPKTLSEFFDELPEHQRKMIEDAATEASDLQRKAVDAGVDLSKPISPELAEQMRLPAGSTLYDAARKFADHLSNIHADVPELTREFLTEQGVLKGAQEAANWLDAEIKVQKAAIGMIEPTFGVVRRPVPVVEKSQISATGKIEPRSKARLAELEEAMTPLKPGEVQASGPTEQMRKALREMGEYVTEAEKPKSIWTNNKHFDELLDQYAQGLRELGYALEEPKPGQPDRWITLKEEALKTLSPERIKLRILEPLVDDSMQKALHSTDFQRQLLRTVKERLVSQGFKGEALNTALEGVNQLITDPESLSIHSKNYFPDLEYNGNKILSRDDFIKTMDKIDPVLMNKARANALNYITQKQIEQGNTFGMLHAMDSEINRFRMTPEREWRKDPTTEKVATNPSTYAINVAEGVIRDNEIQPLIMPYEGTVVAKALREIAKSEKREWTENQRVRLLDLANDLERMQSADVLKDPLNNMFAKVFEQTEAKPPDVHNLYMDPAVLRAMKEHMSAITDFGELNTMQRMLVTAVKMANKSLVAMSTRALMNNNMSNTLLQTITRGGVGFIPKLVTESLNFHRYLEGATGDMTPEQVRMYDAISKRRSLYSTQFDRVFGDKSNWQKLKQSTGLSKLEAMARASDVNWLKVVEKNKDFRNFMVDMYTKFGDLPFRLEEMAHVYKDVSSKVSELEPGRSIEVPVAKYRDLKLTKLEDGTVSISDMAGRKEPKIVAMDSPVLADVYAAAADLAQEGKFLNPKRMGLWAKSLHKKGMAPISGIFSWYMGAMDIPFIKQGLGYKTLEGPTSFKTNSPKIQLRQANEFASWSLRRAMMVNASQSAFMDQRNVRDLRQSLGHNPALEATVVAQANDPAYVRYKNLEPLMFLAPTTGFLNSIAGAVRSLQFAPLFHNPEFYDQIMYSDLDWANMPQEELDAIKEQSPEIGEEGQRLRNLAKEDPKAYKNRALIKRNLERWASNQVSNPEDVFRTLGLSGAPLVRWLMEVQRGGMTANNAFKTLGSFVFGATPYSVFDIAMALGGEAGSGPMRRLSSYGTVMHRSGETRPDASTMAQYAVNQLLSFGWKTAFYGTGDEAPDDERGYPMAKAAMNKTRDTVMKSVLNAVKQDIQKTNLGLSEDQAEEKAKNNSTYLLLKNAFDRVLEEKQQNLRSDMEMLYKDRQERPSEPNQ